MKIVSVNVGHPRLLSWNGPTFSTGIFKDPVPGRIRLRRTNLDGDRQADLSVHGGVDKAVYGYPSEHYPYWSELLSRNNLLWGAFGENFTTEGLLEERMSVGDRYRIGSAVVMAKTPRLPCFKLAGKFRRDQIIEEFLISGRSGFYFSVIEEGEVAAGDEFEFLGGETPTVTIVEANRLYSSTPTDLDLLRRATQVQSLPDGWREKFQAKLDSAENDRRVESASPVR